IVLNKVQASTCGVLWRPGCRLQNVSTFVAINMAKEAIELYLDSCQAHGESIPRETGLESLTLAVKKPVS
ncbi:MAG: hypothetical protein JXA46_11325, partial [Dehalococcoidales bacterium]|nr:hypothetical protein [Dehalococcoidales bacterium]